MNNTVQLNTYTLNMKKGSKKHTIALSTTSSIDKFPNTSTKEIISDIKNSKELALENAKSALMEAFGGGIDKIKNDVIYQKLNTETNTFETCSISEFRTLPIFDKIGMISSEEHAKLIESTPEISNHQYDKLDAVFNKKLNSISSSISCNTNKDTIVSSVPIVNGFPETDIYKKFHENMKTYPAYISVEGATLLNVAFATEQPVFLSKLPATDIEAINKQLDKLNNPNIIREHSIVKMDNTKDFELWFVTEKSTKIENAPITKQKLDDTKDFELYFYDINTKLNNIKIRLFNTVIHPEPINTINTIGVPLSINGELLVEASPVDVKVRNGTLEMNWAKDRFKYLAGITDKEQFKCESNSQYKVELPITNEPVIIKNKNAYEVRLSLVDTATEIVKITSAGQILTGEFVFKVLQTAKDLYAFVENKK